MGYANSAICCEDRTALDGRQNIKTRADGDVSIPVVRCRITEPCKDPVVKSIKLRATARSDNLLGLFSKIAGGLIEVFGLFVVDVCDN